MTTTKPKAAPKRDRSGFYNTPAGKLMSVTTILSNGIPKPNLVHWAAWEVAKSAVDNLPRLVRVRGQQQRDQAVDWLRKAAETKRDTAANLGSAVHKAVECQILDQPAPEPTEEQRPFLAAFNQFVADWRPQWESTELVVAHPEHGWAGTLDWLATLDGLGPALVLGDWKTGKGVYAEAALQLSAYIRAKVGWMANGTEVEVPAAARAVVVHLRPDKYPGRGYAVLPMDTSDRVYEKFRAAQEVAAYVKGMADELVGDPIEPAVLQGVS
jgi:hypothetical protein